MKDLQDGLVRSARRCVHPLGRDRGIRVGDRGDPGHLVDLVGLLAVGVAASVPALVVAKDDRVHERAPRARVADQLKPGSGMGPDDLPLRIGELARLVQDLRGYRQLADVVQQQSHAEAGQPLVALAVLALAAVVGPALLAHQAATDHQTQRGDVDRVLDDVRVGAGVVGQGQATHAGLLDLQQDSVNDLRQRVGGRGRQRAARGDGALGLLESGRHEASAQQPRLV
jgi:hypothetical protein